MQHQRSPLRRLLRGFTLIELLTVMTIIAILAALILYGSGYALKKAALARAFSEIQAISAACEHYKQDNGTYPHQQLAVSGSIQTTTNVPIPSDTLDPRTNGNSIYTVTSGNNATNSYTAASLELYEALTGDLSLTGTGNAGTPNYLSEGLKQDVYGRLNMGAAVSGSNPVEYLSDPFGNCYGYSTACDTTISSGSSTVSGYNYPPSFPGFNMTFDLWSTGGNTGTPSTPPGQTGDPALGWIKNHGNNW